MTHFIHHHWLARNPVGAVAISFHTEMTEGISAAYLHEVLGDRRRDEFRPKQSDDSLTRIQCLLNTLTRAT